MVVYAWPLAHLEFNGAFLGHIGFHFTASGLSFGFDARNSDHAWEGGGLRSRGSVTIG